MKRRTDSSEARLGRDGGDVKLERRNIVSGLINFESQTILRE